MTLDTLVAILALLVAGIAVAPRSKILAIKSRIQLFDWMGGIVAVLGVHALLFYENLAGRCQVPNWMCIVPKWPFPRDVASPGQVAYFLVVLVISYAFWKLFFSRLARGRIFAFRELVGNLVHTRDFSALFALLERDFDQLTRIATRNYLTVRIRDRLMSWHVPCDLAVLVRHFENHVDVQPTYKSPISKRFLGAGGRWIATCLPDYARHGEAARDVFRSVFTSRSVVSELARTRPYFSLRILGTNLHDIHDFVDIYFRELLSNSHSILYAEIRSNQNISYTHDYALPDSNKVLHYLFSDTRKAEELSAWRPVGESFIERLDELAFDPEVDPYNRPMGSFDERDKWNDQLFASIRFFDIMVSKALLQDREWHMWLYYFPHFVERMVRNFCADSPLVDKDSEWPTRYSYLLYEVISTLVAWLSMVQHLPVDQANVRLAGASGAQENGNIPKSAVFALSDCLRCILLADHLPSRFRGSIAGLAFSCLFELKLNGKTRCLSEVLVHRLCDRGYRTEERQSEFVHALAQYLSQQDLARWADQIREFDAELHAVA